MAVIEQYRPGDRTAVDALYRRVFGNDAADAHHLRWDWQYRRNPCVPAGGPPVWVAREGPAIVGHFGTIPVRLLVHGTEVDASWGADVMVAPERRREGIGEKLFSKWDATVAASLGLGPDEVSARLFAKLRWPSVGAVPCFVKSLTRRALRRSDWPTTINRLVSAITLPVVKVVGRARPVGGELTPVRRLDHGVTALWERVAPSLAFAVRRDARYLQWRYVSAPHVRYSVVVLRRDGATHGYAAYRHVREPRSRVTLLVDFLADPADRAGFQALLRYVDREARSADSDKIRCYCMHQGFRAVLKRSGYFQVRSRLQLVAKINDVAVPQRFYRDTSAWHVTLGDSDLDH